jgi:hypothetical protein
MKVGDKVKFISRLTFRNVIEECDKIPLNYNDSMPKVFEDAKNLSLTIKKIYDSCKYSFEEINWVWPMTLFIPEQDDNNWYLDLNKLTSDELSIAEKWFNSIERSKSETINKLFSNEYLSPLLKDGTFNAVSKLEKDYCRENGTEITFKQFLQITNQKTYETQNTTSTVREIPEAVTNREGYSGNSVSSRRSTPAVAVGHLSNKARVGKSQS